MNPNDLDRAFRVIARTVVPAGSLLRSWRLTGGVSAEVHALEVECGRTGPKRVVVRSHASSDGTDSAARKTTREFSVLTQLHRIGLRVPEPLHLDTSNELLSSPYLVTTWVEGTSSVTEGDLPAALRQMAGFLAHLHGIDVRTLDLPRLPRHAVHERLRTCPPHTQHESLLHGDFWPGNLLWNGGELAAVIDWEDAAIGSALSDVACCRAELDVAFGESAVADFTRHYLTARPCDVSDLPLWDVYVGSAALASMHQWKLPPEIEVARRALTTEFVARASAQLLRSR